MNTPLPVAAAALVTALLAACAAPPAPAASAAASTAEADCSALPARSRLADTRLSTRYAAAGTRRAGNAPAGIVLPGHCVVTGSIGARTGIDGSRMRPASS